MNLTIKNQNGFSLPELLIALGISGFVLAGVCLTYDSQQNCQVKQQLKVRMQQSLRAAIYVMARELRLAGYDPGQTGEASIITADKESVSFSYFKEGSLKTITYLLYDAYQDGDLDIGRQVGSSPYSKRAIAENMQAVEFLYTLADGSRVTLPSDPEEIRSVTISLLARTEYPIRGFVDTKTYTTPSGCTWGPYFDPFLRKLQTVCVHFRNMGL
jgi:type IV pilus assembly protein PilW